MSCVKYKWTDSKTKRWEELQFFSAFITLIEFKRALVQIKKLYEGPPCELTVYNSVTGERYLDDNWSIANKSMLAVRQAGTVQSERWKVLCTLPDEKNILLKFDADSSEIHSVMKQAAATPSPILNQKSKTLRCRQCGNLGHRAGDCPMDAVDAKKKQREAWVYKPLGTGMPKQCLVPVSNPKQLKDEDFGTPNV